MSKKMTEAYIAEKLDTYEVAIHALEIHESADQPVLSRKLCDRLLEKLQRERDKWFNTTPL